MGAQGPVAPQESVSAQKIRSLRATVAELEARDDLLGASNTMQIVMGLAPDDPVIRQEALELQRRLAERMAPKHREGALEATRAGQHDRAAGLWQKFLLASPGDVEANVGLARALLQLRRDLPLAAEAARRVIAATPTRIDGHLLLAEVFLAADKPASARAAVDAAARIDAKSSAVKEFLARLR